MEIRRASAADAEAVLDCCRQVGGETDCMTFGAEGVAVTVEEERAFLERMARERSRLFLVAAEGGQVIGTASLSGFAQPRLAHRGEVSVAVRKAAWGRGIGSALLAEVIRFAGEEAGLRILSLEVRSDNARAIALYRRFGFEKTGTFRGFLRVDGTDYDVDLMQLALTACQPETKRGGEEQEHGA